MIHKFENKSPLISESCFISDSADVIGDVEIGENSSIWFGSVVRGDMNQIRIGSKTNIQDNSVVHVTTKVAPTFIGNGVTIGHRAIIHGCTINDNCLIGMGCIIMDLAIIGKGSIIAAGALIPPGMKVPSRKLMVGIPAKPIRDITSQEYSDIKESALHYILFSRKYKKLQNLK